MGWKESLEQLKDAYIAGLEEGKQDADFAADAAFKQGAMTFAAELLTEYLGLPLRVTVALENLADSLDKIEETLKRISPPPSLDLAGNPLPPMPSQAEIMQERLVKAVEHYVEGTPHGWRLSNVLSGKATWPFKPNTAVKILLDCA